MKGIEMARYDEVFADFQTKQAGLLKVIAGHPEIADELRAAWSLRPVEVDVDDPTDEARANALANLLRETSTVIFGSNGQEGE